MNILEVENCLGQFSSRIQKSIRRDFPLGSQSWLQAGGAADILFTPQDHDDLCQFLSGIPTEYPVLPIGRGTNVIIRDGGIRGIVIRLSSHGFGNIERVGEDEIKVGAAVSDKNLSEAALEAGIGGFEFYRGIPGRIGGALRMNAGANGTETMDRVIEAYAVDRQGVTHTLSKDDMGFNYRSCGVPSDFIFTGALFKGYLAEQDLIQKEMDKVIEHRNRVQPVDAKTAGSTFKNPSDDIKAGVLIEDAGLKGHSIGGAMVSEKHANFLINHSNASAADIEALGELIKKEIKQLHGIELEWEVKRLGVH